jgi:Spy/CpxP family protein refolding chaperone
MKRITVWTTVAVVLVLMAFVIVRADARGTRGWRGHGWHHRGPASFLAHDLKLSDAQRAQIHTLWQAERPTLSAHVHELLAENKEMNAIAGQANPDPAKVQEIASREGATIAAMLVEKEHLQSKIASTVLNPEQRTRADELQKKWESRLDHFADRLASQPAEK